MPACTGALSSDMGPARCGTSVYWTTPRRRTLWWWLAHCESKATAQRASWRNRSSRPAVPLSKVQTEVLRLLASQRDPESYVAGATPLNRNAPRYSGDIDIFHDREERVAAAALNDAKILEAAGYGVAWLRQLPLIYAAEVSLEAVMSDDSNRT